MSSGRRVRKTVNDTVTEYFYFGSEVISEKQGSAWTDYIFFGGQRVALNTGASLATAKFLHSDHLGSTRVCTDVNGNATGQCAYEPFGEFTGGASACTIPTSYRFAGMQFDSETGFYRRHEPGAELFADAGMRFRSQTGSHPTWFCGFSSRADSTTTPAAARQYDPSQGRWLSVDPLSGDPTDPQSLNRYVYVLNDPVNLTDPLGLDGGVCMEYDPETGEWYIYFCVTATDSVGGSGVGGNPISSPNGRVPRELAGLLGEPEADLVATLLLLFLKTACPHAPMP